MVRSRAQKSRATVPLSVLNSSPHFKKRWFQLRGSVQVSALIMWPNIPILLFVGLVHQCYWLQLSYTPDGKFSGACVGSSISMPLTDKLAVGDEKNFVIPMFFSTSPTGNFDEFCQSWWRFLQCVHSTTLFTVSYSGTLASNWQNMSSKPKIQWRHLFAYLTIPCLW